MLKELLSAELHLPVIPCSMDLAQYFQKFIKHWAGMEVEYLGQAPDGPVEMPVEMTIRWKGAVAGTLVIRAYGDFLKWLMESRDYKPLNLCTGKEIFHEMGSLYCVFLIQHFWISEASELGLLFPRASSTGDWPRREPDSTCGILVANNPVEIRLWLD